MSARLIAGLVLVILGIGALLDQLTTFDFGSFISDWWPMLLVLVGVVQLTTRSAPVAGALVVIAAGLVLEAGALELLPVGFWELFWPVILIAIGASLLLPRAFGRQGLVGSADTVHYFAAFGGREDRLTSTAFQGGTITALFGGWSNKTLTHRKDASSAPVDDADRKTLKIKAFVAFGGFEVKN